MANAQNSTNVLFQAFEQIDPSSYIIMLDGLPVAVPKVVFDRIVEHMKWKKRLETENRIYFGPVSK